MLSDKKIRELSLESGMISPFIDYGMGGSSAGSSYGLSSCGYDVRLADRFSDNRNDDLVNRKSFYLKPGEFILGHSVEMLSMPENVSAFCLTKSSLARKGIDVTSTKIQPGWKGQLVIEIFNKSENVIPLVVGEGICELSFFETGPVENPYSGKYQNQKGVTKAL